MKIKYPSEPFLIVRPCYKAVTWQCQASAKLLTALVYLSNPKNQDGEEATNEIEVEGTSGDVRISCSQARLIELLVDEVSEKTLHDVATPFLQLLGFIDIENTPRGIEYILHFDYFLKTLALYVPKQKSQPQLEKFLISNLQLEKFLIEWELETVLNAIRKISKCDKKNFQLLLEIVLIQNRNFSNSQRGRKSRQEVNLEVLLQTPKNLIEESKNLKEREENVAAPFVASPSLSSSLTHSHATSYSQADYKTNATEEVTQVSDGMAGVNGYRKGQAEHETTHRALPDVVLPAPVEQGISTPPVTQQTPPMQVMGPALSGDASEGSGESPLPAPLRLSHFFYDIDVFSEDTWIVLPGQATETASGEVVRTNDPPEVETTANTSMNDAVRGSTTEPASPSKTVPVSGNKKPRGKAAKPEETNVLQLPVMPLPDAPWPNAETAVAIVEAKKQRRYSDTTRTQELTEARKVLKMLYQGSPLTRMQFEQAWDDMAAWPFWKEHTNVKPMIRTLRKDDKIIAMLDEHTTKPNGKENDSRKRGGSPHTETNPEHFISRTLDVERNELRRLAMLEKAAQIRAARDTATTQQSLVASPTYGYAM